MARHPHHYKIAIALAISAGAWGIYWLPQRILEEGGLTGGWGTIAQMVIGVLLLTPISIWRKFKGRTSGLELPFTGFLIGSGFIFQSIVLTGLIYYILHNTETIIDYINNEKEQYSYRRNAAKIK